MNYKIAIPSYKRSKTLKEKTLATLTRNGIDPSIVTIFVATSEEKDIYAKELADTPYDQIEVAVPKLYKARNYIMKYYDAGTQLVQLDDDILDFKKRIDEKTLVPTTDAGKEVFEKGFKACAENDAYLWGVYAVDNPFFMSDKVAVGLYFCVGVCWGIIVRHDDDLLLTIDEKEDYQRTLQHYVKDGAVCRLNDITIKTTYLKEPGGMQEYRNDEMNTKSAEFLEKTYPNLCSMYIRKSSGRAELKLRDKNPQPRVEKFNVENFM